MNNYNPLGCIYFIVMFCLFPFAIKAQAPGYLGKKFTVEFSTGIGPAIDGPTQNNRGYNNILGNRYDTEEPPTTHGLGFNVAFEGSVNYVVKRFGSVGLTISQYHTGVRTFMDAASLSTQASNVEIENLHRVNVRSIGLRYTLFRSNKGALGPIGRSYYFGIEKMFITGEIIDRILRYNSSDEQAPLSGHRPLNITQDYQPFAISFGFQKTSLYFDQMLVRVGVGMHVPLAPLGETINYIEGNYSNHPDYETSQNEAIFEVDTYKRLLFHGLFRFEVGVGYLLF